MRICLIVSMLWLRLAVAQMPDCFSPLAFLSTSEDAAVPTIVTAYERLLDTAGAKLNESVLARLRAGESPFVVNELSGEDFLALRRHLAEFKSLVERRKWDTPALRRALSEHLADRQRALETSRQGIDRTVVDMQADRRVSVGKGTGRRHGMSSDGAWLVGVESDVVPPALFSPWHVVVHSVKTGETFRVPGPDNNYYGVPTFDATGAHVLFPLSGFQLEKVPFSAGKLDFSRAEKVGEPDREGARSSVPGPLERGVNPNVVYADHRRNGEYLLFRFDLNTKQRVTANLATLTGPTERVLAWQVIPGTDQFALAIMTGPSMRIETYEMDSTGKLNQQKTYGPWSPSLGAAPLTWAANGKPLTLLNDKPRRPGLYEISEGAAGPKLILKLALFKVTPEVGLSPIGIAVRPGRDEVALLYNGGPITGRNHIAVWNLQTKQQVGATEVPAGVENLEYTPDGARLVLRETGEKDGYVVVVRPERINSP